MDSETDEGASKTASQSARAEKAEEMFRKHGSMKNLIFTASGNVFVNKGSTERDHMSAAVT